MPLKNDFFGVFKTLVVGNKFVIASEATRSREMTIAAKNLIQGTALNRIMDIGGVKETISIKAPILIGGGSYIDGRTLLSDQIQNALDPSTTTLPILKNADISITDTSGAVALTLQSDGNPNSSQVFAVSSFTADQLTDGTVTIGTGITNGSDVNVLDPLSQMPTRMAAFYDFRVSLAGYIYYIKSATITVEVDTQQVYFLSGKDGSTSNGWPVPGANAQDYNPGPFNTSSTGTAEPTGSDPNNVPSGSPSDTSNPGNPYNFGTQFPWLGVSGVKIHGTGSAVALLSGADGTGGWNNRVNVSLQAGDTELTLQQPGNTITSNYAFAFEVYNALNGQWHNLFTDSSGNELFDLSRALISKADFKVEPGLLTVNFNFNCYVAAAPVTSSSSSS